MSKWILAAAAALVLPVLPAQAGQYDGKWVVDFPSVTLNSYTTQGGGCPALQLVIDIKDEAIHASLRHERDNPLEVKNTNGPAAEPVSGTVAADGSFTASWEGYQVTGRLGGKTGEAQVTGECGPRAGASTRIAAQ